MRKTAQTGSLAELKDLIHGNMAPLIEIIDDPNSRELFLASPFYPAGSLEERVKQSSGGIPEAQAKRDRSLMALLRHKELTGSERSPAKAER